MGQAIPQQLGQKQKVSLTGRSHTQVIQGNTQAIQGHGLMQAWLTRCWVMDHGGLGVINRSWAHGGKVDMLLDPGPGGRTWACRSLVVVTMPEMRVCKSAWGGEGLGEP